MLRRSAVALLVALCFCATSTEQAVAGDGTTNVQCQQGAVTGCTVGVGIELPGAGSDVNAQPGVAGVGTCTNWRGDPSPCSDPNFGWMGSNGCYWKIDTDYQPPPWNTADQHVGEQGAWFLFTCLDNFPGTAGGIIWLPTSGPLGVAPNPEELALQATNRLALPQPRIELSPGGDQMVHVPTWLWLSPEEWTPIDATAAVPGVSVTATATPLAVTWTLGDGTSVVCEGPGTPYSAGRDPAAASPDCGHTYSRSSAGESGLHFAVAATVTWGVTWQGGGRSGELPALTTTSAVDIRVAEAQAINYRKTST